MSLRFRRGKQPSREPSPTTPLPEGILPGSTAEAVYLEELASLEGPGEDHETKHKRGLLGRAKSFRFHRDHRARVGEEEEGEGADRPKGMLSRMRWNSGRHHTEIDQVL